jgi:SAM-dependent methyltransferase
MAEIMQNNLAKFFSGPIFEETLFRYPQGPFLEIGCGGKPLLPDLLKGLGDIDCLDWDGDVLAKNRDTYKEARFIEGDIQSFVAPEQYGVILDAHLLHCLPSIDAYQMALRNVYKSLKPGGLFMVETMISHSQMAFELMFKYDTDSFQLYKGERVSRLVLPSIVIEEQFIKAGFEIKFMRVQEDLRMIPHDKREEAIPEDPQVIRLIASKA